MTGLDAALYTALVAHLTIAAGYVGIAIYIAPGFVLSRAAFGARLARLAGVTFFVLCALTHTEHAVHIWQHPEQMGWMADPFSLGYHILQAAAGWAFLVAGTLYLDVRIRSRDG